jgi:hypothetical protein
MYPTCVRLRMRKWELRIVVIYQGPNSAPLL